MKALSHGSKVFVLDTNVLIYDPTALFRFKEHHVYIPMTVLEELDHLKKGSSDPARASRQSTRLIENIITQMDAGDLESGYFMHDLNPAATGLLFLQPLNAQYEMPSQLSGHKADNHILGTVLQLIKEYPDLQFVLVSKDINLRIKALALQIPIEDYRNDIVVEDSDCIYSGIQDISETFLEEVEILKSYQTDVSFYDIKSPLCTSFIPNLILKNNKDIFQVTSVDGETATIKTLRNYKNQTLWGIQAKNDEQNIALNFLSDPNLHLVTILGQAGSGKTLLTLAASLDAVFKKHNEYDDIIFTRITVPIGEDIGFLPGTEEEKLGPWMGALEDNLEFLARGDSQKKGINDSGSWGKKATEDLLKNKIKIKAINFMRGRTFIKKILVIDEAQNLTPKQMKTLITRSGEGTKVICLGNVAQIDSTYMNENNCGLTYLVERMKGWEHYAHITLARVERSSLADEASKRL